ncbi:MAG: 5-formyltetrahydrofolate cyclo-ligase [Oscillospiraceae bacterium]|nr:5-formyltetrahydrofolate cyclo-ligase [Oscillospiraceae bacterium]
MTKKECRQKYLKLRNDIPASQKAEFDKILTDKILSLPEFESAECILLFASVGSEVDTWDLFSECIRQNKKVYFPKCIDGERMEFLRAASKNDFTVGKYGIPEPISDEKYISNSKNDLSLIPALAVGRDFSRLGYGKGYYDRFLKTFKGISVCPVYSGLLCESVPTDEFDIQPKIIITPTESIRR